MSHLGLYVDPKEKQTQVQQVRTGSNEHRVVVIIRQSKTSDCFLAWDVKNNVQVESFDCAFNPKVFWDQDGNAYATEKDIVYFSKQGVRLKCYDVRDMNARTTTQN